MIYLRYTESKIRMVVTVKDFREGAEARRKKKLYTRRKLMHSQRGTDRRNLIFSLLLLSPPFLPRISFFSLFTTLSQQALICVI